MHVALYTSFHLHISIIYSSSSSTHHHHLLISIIYSPPSKSHTQTAAGTALLTGTGKQIVAVIALISLIWRKLSSPHTGMSQYPKINPSPLINEFNDSVKYQSRWEAPVGVIVWGLLLTNDYCIDTVLRRGWCPLTSSTPCSDSTGTNHVYELSPLMRCKPLASDNYCDTLFSPSTASRDWTQLVQRPPQRNWVSVLALATVRFQLVSDNWLDTRQKPYQQETQYE